jgi:tetratricopeptide (TPR) repeat protein
MRSASDSFTRQWDDYDDCGSNEHMKAPLKRILLAGLVIAARMVDAQPSSRQFAAISAESAKLLKRASEEFGKQEYEAAIRDVSDAIAKSPNADYLYSFRGTAYNESGNKAKALEDFTRAIEIDPAEPYPYRRRGLIKESNEDYSGAVNDLTTAIKLEPGNSANFLFRAVAEGRSDKLDEAISDFTKTISLDGENSMAYVGRAIAERERSDYADALRDLNKAIELDPNNRAAFRNRGSLSNIKRDWSSAISDYEKAKSIDPSNHDVTIELLTVDLRLRNTERIKSLEDEVAEWKNGWTKTIGLFLAGDLSEAAFLDASRNGENKKIDEQVCECFYYIGFKQTLSGDLKKGRASFAKAVEAGNRGIIEFALARAELNDLSR